MSLDLYQDRLLENVGNLTPTANAEPLFFENAIPGAAKVAGQFLAGTARQIGMLGGGIGVGVDAAMSAITGRRSTAVQDLYFSAVDKIATPAVDYWTPAPNEVGTAGQIIGTLAGTLTTALASAPLAVAGSMDIGTDLVKKGVPTAQAAGVAALQGAGMATGIWMPILGQNLWQRALVGGAGFNILQGAVTRGGSGLILHDRPEGEMFHALSPKDIKIDALLGLAFGSWSHINPESRAQGREAWQRISDWMQGAKPSDIAALATLRDAQHTNYDSTPGAPVTPADLDTHVTRLKTAVDQLARGEQVNVGEIKTPPVVRVPLTIETLPQQVLMAAREQASADTYHPQGPELEMVLEAFPNAQRVTDEEGHVQWIDAEGKPLVNQLWVEADRRHAQGLIDNNITIYDNAHVLEWEARKQAELAEGEARKQAAGDPLFVSDPARSIEQLRNAAELVAQANEVRREEGLPRITDPAITVAEDITRLPASEQIAHIEEAVYQRLRAMDMEHDEAAANAAIWRAFFKTAGESYGVNPAQLLREYGIDAQRMRAADALPEAMFQPRKAAVYATRADQLERAFTGMGLVARRDSSTISLSEYVEIESPEYTASDGERGEVLKFRVSDHELPGIHAQPDFEVIAGDVAHGGVHRAAALRGAAGTWLDAVAWVADRYGIEPVGNAKRYLAEQAASRQRVADARREADERRRQAGWERFNVERRWAESLPPEALITRAKRGALVSVLDGKLISRLEGNEVLGEGQPWYGQTYTPPKDGGRLIPASEWVKENTPLLQENSPAPAEPPRRGLEDASIREALQHMADNEAGWLEIGGRLDIARLIKEFGPDAVDENGRPTKLGVVAFTKWVPKQDWWLTRPGHPGRGLNEDKTRDAVRKALAGEKLKKLERYTVEHMIDVINERAALADAMGPERLAKVVDATLQENMEPTIQNTEDVDLLAKAMEIDAGRMAAVDEELAAKYGANPTPANLAAWDAELMAAAKRMIDEYSANQHSQDTPNTSRAATDESGQTGERGAGEPDDGASAIRDAINRYDEGDDDIQSIQDLADRLEQIADEYDNRALEAAVREYRERVQDDFDQWGGRDDAQAYEDALYAKVVEIGNRGKTDSQTLYQRDDPDTWYYSELAKQLNAAQMKAAPAKGWLDYLKSLQTKGVKADEIRWSGIEEWIQLMGAQRPKTSPGFGLVEEFKFGDGDWEQADDLGIYAKTESEALAKLTPEVEASVPKFKGRDAKDSQQRITVRAFDAVDFGETETPKITKEQIVDYLAGNGVRVETIMEGGKGTKTLEDNAIRHEVTLLRENGFNPETNPEDPSFLAFMDDETGDLITSSEMMDYALEAPRGSDERTKLERSYRAAREIERYWNNNTDAIPPKYSEYQLKGDKEAYQVFKLVLPKIPTPSKANQAALRQREIDTLQKEWNDYLTARQLPTMSADEIPQSVWDEMPGPDREYVYEFRNRWENAIQEDATAVTPFTNNHWDEENILAFVRANTREIPVHAEASIEDIERRIMQAVPSATRADSLGSGAPGAALAKGLITQAEAAKYSGHRGFLNMPYKTQEKVLFLEEIQSDWAQKGRKEGFKDDTPKPEPTLPEGSVAIMEQSAQQMAAADEPSYTARTMREAEAYRDNALSLWGVLPEDILIKPGMRDRDPIKVYVARYGVQDPDGSFLETTGPIYNLYSADGAKRAALERIREDAKRKGIVPAAPFVAKPEYALFKDGQEIKRTDKSGKEFTERYDTQARADAAAAKAGAEVRYMGLGPDTEAWVTLVLKRMISYAAQNGYDRIAWTTGKQQVDRWENALRQRVDVIEWTKTEDGIQLVGYKSASDRADAQAREMVQQRIDAYTAQIDSVLRGRDRVQLSDDEYEYYLRLVEDRQREQTALNNMNEKGRKVVDTTQSENTLSDAIGKVMANRIIQDPNQSGTIEGDQITIDDTGMAAFYDRIVPNVANTVLKKLGGGNVEIVDVNIPQKTGKHGGAAEGETLEVGTAPLELKPFSTPDYDQFGNVQNFYDERGQTSIEPMVAETTMKINGEDHPVLVVFGGDDVSEQNRVTVLSADQTNDFELARGLDPIKRPITKETLQQELQDRWANVFLRGFDLQNGEWPRPKGAEKSPQMSFSITDAMKAKAAQGLPLFQRPEPAATGPRGAISLSDGRAMIGLFENANESTFAHESAHLFLKITKDLAERNTATPQAAQDWATLANWLGIEGGGISTASHEKFARGWEKYLQEGVAPNEGLRAAFQRFRDWLLEIYNSLTGRGLEVELNDEIRGVMARMLDSQARDPAPKREAPMTQPEGASQAQQPAEPSTALESRPSDATGLSSPEQPKEALEEPVDMVQAEAQRIATERPDILIPISTDAENGTQYQTVADFLAAAKAEADAIRKDTALITAAAQCALGIL